MQTYGAVSSSLGKFCPAPGNSTSHFYPEAGSETKIFARVAGIRSLKKIFRGLAWGGGGGFTQLELTETL